MPIYEYRCKSCGRVHELIQRFSDPPKRKCPDCSGRLEKLVSRTAFLLKGGGWYDQGYSKAGSAGSSSNGSSSSSKSDSKPDSKSESKSESKPKTGGGKKDS
jgi:putative FmdB family regulatory protein